MYARNLAFSLLVFNFKSPQTLASIETHITEYFNNWVPGFLMGRLPFLQLLSFLVLQVQQANKDLVLQPLCASSCVTPDPTCYVIEIQTETLEGFNELNAYVSQCPNTIRDNTKTITNKTRINKREL